MEGGVLQNGADEADGEGIGAVGNAVPGAGAAKDSVAKASKLAWARAKCMTHHHVRGTQNTLLDAEQVIHGDGRPSSNNT